MRNIFLLAVALLFLALPAFTQCAFTVNTFPYNESFESSAGGWVSGGTNNDWALGTPNKAYIQSAGAGNTCWVTGSLTGSFYNFAQRSYVYSPCFDFTNLQKPFVKFKIYWEGENQYDGACFQYTTNSGATWNNVGAFNDPIDCYNQNWFNLSNISNLNTLATPQHGWGGTIQPTSGGCVGGNGSGDWVEARHCMNYLVGAPNVQFRFAFGAGTSCNAYDGFAFDDITISEAPLAAANYSFACNGQSLGYSFTSNAPCANSYVWNFDDPNSGSNNTSTLLNPSHQFSSPGTYNVTLTVTGPCNTTTTISNQINTLNLLFTTTDVLCYGVNIGTITTTVQNNSASGGVFGLSPVGLSNTTGFFNNLAAINYTMLYTANNNCVIQKPVSIFTPTSLVFANLSTASIACSGQSNASLTALVTGGINPKNYTILPGGTTNNNGLFTNLSAGTYTVQVVDANGCTISSSITVAQTTGLTITNFNTQNVLCHGASTGVVTMGISGGLGTINYVVQPGGQSSTTGTINTLSAGTYTITATDANFCTISTVFSLSEAPPIVINSAVTTPAQCVPPNSGSLIIDATNGVGLHEYSIGSGFTSSNQLNNLLAGTYTLVVKDANGCTKSSVIQIGSEPPPDIQIQNIVQPTCTDSENGSIQLSATSTTSIITGYLLQPGNLMSSNGLFSNLSSGSYTATVSDANGCTKSVTASLVSPGNIQINQILVDNDSCTMNLYNQVTVITLGGTDPKTFRLSPGGTINSTGIFYNLEPDTYYVQAKDANGCATNSKFTVTKNECCNVPFVANAFSPNNDGLNDELHLVYFPGVTIEKFLIMNRYGQVVFSPQHTLDRWDGKFKSVECEIGSYYYLLQYKCNRTNERGVVKGDITLLR